MWRKTTSTGTLRNILLFIPFIVIATIFWFIVALDDDLQRDYSVKVEIVNVPDSITFISDPPMSIRVSVRDHGTRLAEHAFYGAPVIRLDFSTLAGDGTFRVTPQTLQSHLRNIFGSSAQLLAITPDSISLSYTANKAKNVPIVVVSDIVPEIGKTISGAITTIPSEVKVYSVGMIADTLRCVYTYPIVRRSIGNSLTIEAAIQPIPGCRIEPPKIKVNIPVEPLANRSIIVPINTDNVPAGESLMVYPRSVKVTYLVPMSSEDVTTEEFDVAVDYADINNYSGKNIPLRLHTLPSKAVSATMELDSVEYTVIRQ